MVIVVFSRIEEWKRKLCKVDQKLQILECEFIKIETEESSASLICFVSEGGECVCLGEVREISLRPTDEKQRPKVN